MALCPLAPNLCPEQPLTIPPLLLSSFFPSSLQVGDIVEVVANSAVQKGMPHKGYHGRTGIVFNVTKRAVGVEVSQSRRERETSPPSSN